MTTVPIYSVQKITALWKVFATGSLSRVLAIEQRWLKVEVQACVYEYEYESCTTAVTRTLLASRVVRRQPVYLFCCRSNTLTA